VNDFTKQGYYQGKLTSLLARDNLKPHLQKTVIGGTRSAQARQRLSSNDDAEPSTAAKSLMAADIE
jgi:hypothetical protein